jgi:hypothetical protein
VRERRAWAVVKGIPIGSHTRATHLSLMGIGISGLKTPYLYRKKSTKSTRSTLGGFPAVCFASR